MKIRLLAMVLALAATLPATAQITTVQRAHELPVANVRLPVSASGTLTFKACATCPTTTARVNDDTRWLIDNESVSLQQFREVFAGKSGRGDEYMMVRHHLEKNLITIVAISAK